MLRKTMTLFPAALIATLPFAALAGTMDETELEMFRGASVTIQQASDAALKAHSGTLAAVAFSDEDGRAAYETVVIGNDGQPWTVLVDAKTGEVFATELSSAMEDHEDGARGRDDEDHGEDHDND